MQFLILILIVSVSYFFYLGQNRKNNIGGKIAPSKLLWLDYTLITWFFLPVYFYFTGVRGGAFDILYMISVSMWIRGVIEIVMLYITKNWTPPLGIAHDIMTIVILLLGIYMSDIKTFVHYIFVASLFLSLCLETYYALIFYKNMKEQTKGDKAIWFASKDNPNFKKVLKVTMIGNFIVYGCLILFLFSEA